MGYITRAIKKLKTEGLTAMIRRVRILLPRKLYQLRARIEDWRIGGVSVEHKKVNRFASTGAYHTESTNYIWLDKIFKRFPLKDDDVFIDIGCGEGRVLTYLYLRKFRGKMIGIELDPEAAEIAVRRTENCANIQICQGNVLESADVIRDATVLYLFNPFNEAVLTGFVELVEKCIDHPVLLCYSNDMHRRVLDKRENWFILRRDSLESPTLSKTHYTIYRYQPK